MIIVLCPNCKSRCRLKNQRTNPAANQGRCPQCGHLFPIPPSNDLLFNTQETVKKNAGKTEQKKIDWSKKDRTEEHKQPSKIPLIKVATFLIILIVLLFFAIKANLPTRHYTNKQIPHNSLNRAQSQTAGITVKLPSSTQLAPENKNKIIAAIKHHALVTDASINFLNNQFQLALLVSKRTPASYSERLGRQFVHYLKEELSSLDRNQTKFSFVISVYYPNGTRVRVTTNDDSMEEEILPK